MNGEYVMQLGRRKPVQAGRLASRRATDVAAGRSLTVAAPKDVAARIAARAAALSAFLFLSSAIASAQVPGMVSFQGVLKDGGGTPLAGPVTLDFRIFDAQTTGNLVDMDGDGVVENTVGQDVKEVATQSTGGVVSVAFGPVSPSVFNGQPRFIEVTIVNPGPATALARVPMTTAPAVAEQLYARGTTNVAVSTDSAGHVGIGTTTPSDNLTVSTGSTNTVIAIQNTSFGGRTWGVVSSGIGSGTGAGFLRFRDLSAAVDRMVISPEGFVGINTQSPEYLLHILGVSRTVQLDTPQVNGDVQVAFGRTDGAGDPTMILTYWGQSDRNTLALTNEAGSGLHVSNGGNVMIGSFSQSNFGGSGRLVVMDGNVGIGTTTPTGRLHVSGGPNWTSSGWRRALALSVDGAIEFAQDSSNLRFGIGSSGDRLWVFSTPVEDTSQAALYRMVIDSDGNVGIGAINPVARLDVNGVARMSGFQLPTGASAGRILTSDGTGVGTWQPLPTASGDLSGTYPNLTIVNGAITLTKVAANAIDSARIVDGSVSSVDIADGAVGNADLSNGSVTSAKLASDALSLDPISGGAMRVVGGQVAIGSGAAHDLLAVAGGINVDELGQNPGTLAGALRFGGASGEGISSRRTTGPNQFGLEFWTGGQHRIQIANSGEVGINADPAAGYQLKVGGAICSTTNQFLNCSDRRYKRNFRPLAGALESVVDLHPVRFEWRVDAYPGLHFPDKPQIGFIAQEVEPIVPEVVTCGSDGYYSMDYGRLTPILTAAIQELHAKHDAEMAQLRANIREQKAQGDALRDEVDDLRTQNEKLQARLSRLESLLAGDNEKGG